MPSSYQTSHMTSRTLRNLARYNSVNFSRSKLQPRRMLASRSMATGLMRMQMETLMTKAMSHSCSALMLPKSRSQTLPRMAKNRRKSLRSSTTSLPSTSTSPSERERAGACSYALSTSLSRLSSCPSGSTSSHSLASTFHFPQSIQICSNERRRGR